MDVSRVVTFGAGLLAGAALGTLVHARCAPKPALPDESPTAEPSPTLSSEPPCDQSAESAELLMCSMCHINLPSSLFTVKQAKRKPHVRKCRPCVDTYQKPTWAPTAAKAPSAAPIGSDAAPAPVGTSVDSPHDPLRLARKAETVLRGRTDRVLLVLENCTADYNHVAVLRTCESMGVQHVWLVKSPQLEAVPKSKFQRGFGRRADYDPLLGLDRARLYASHLDVRTFDTTAQCIEALRQDGREIWATDLRQSATVLDAHELSGLVPERLAIVVGQECLGVTEEMLDEADRCVYLPMSGFTESYNLGVATGLVLQRLLDAYSALYPNEMLPSDELNRLRCKWYSELARSDVQRKQFEQIASMGGAEPFEDPRRPPEHRENSIASRQSRKLKKTGKNTE